MNAHQCTQTGNDFLQNIQFTQTAEAQAILQTLTCKCGQLLQVSLDDDLPRLVCNSCKNKQEVKGFLQDLKADIKFEFSAPFL